MILMYHRIAEESFDPWALAVSPGNFAGQLRWLSDNRTILPLAEFAARHCDRSLPGTAVALTFDDGYACTANVATPLLKQFGAPATVFLPVEFIERGEPYWWDDLQRVVLSSNAEALRADGQLVHLGDKRPDDREWTPGAPPSTPRQAAFHRIWAILRPKRPAGLDACMAELRSQSPAPNGERDFRRPMTPDEVRAAAGDGIDFGSHALSHPWLPSLDHAEKAREIGDSVARCAALTGTRPTSFAYPYGAFDEESERLAQDAGFDCACTTEDRPVSARSRLFALPRVAVANRDSRGLARALAGVSF